LTNRSLTVFAVSVVLTFASLWPAHGILLNWDEVDYEVAANKGIAANMFDRGALTPNEFVNFVLAKWRHSPPSTPAAYDEAQDPLVLRHFHPPFVSYAMALFNSARGDRAARSAQILGAMVFLLATFFLYDSIATTPSWAGYLIVSIVGVTSCWILFSSISYHGWMAAWMVITCGLLARWQAQPDLSTAAVICLTLALAGVTLESALLLFLAVTLYVAIVGPRGPSFADAPGQTRWKPLLAASTLTLGLIVALWPASVGKLSAVRTLALYAYRIVGLGAKEYGSVKAGYLHLVVAILPSVVLILIGAALLLAKRSDWGDKRMKPVMMIGGLYTIGMAFVAISPTYLIPGLVPLAVMAAVTVDQIAMPGRRAVIAALVIATSMGPWQYLRNLSTGDAAARADLAWLAARDTSQLVADGGHVYAYYLGRPVPELSVNYDHRSISFRRDGVYVPATASMVPGRQFLIQRSRKEFVGSHEAAALFAPCSPTERSTFILFDCREGMSK
jgi:hypothetical protein